MKKIYFFPIISVICLFGFILTLLQSVINTKPNSTIEATEFKSLLDCGVRSHLLAKGYPIANVVSVDLVIDKQEIPDWILIRVNTVENPKNNLCFNYKIKIDNSVAINSCNKKILRKEKLKFTECCYEFKVNKDVFFKSSQVSICLQDKQNSLLSGILMTYIKKRIVELNHQNKNALIYTKVSL